MGTLSFYMGCTLPVFTQKETPGIKAECSFEITEDEIKVQV